MKRILLIPSLTLYANKIDPYIPLGMLSLKAASGARCEDVDIWYANEAILSKKFHSSDELANTILDKININEYDIIGLSTLSNSFHHSLRIAHAIKECSPKTNVWMGGPHASIFANEIIKEFPYIDAVFVGESESTLVEVINRHEFGRIDLNDIPGIYTRESNYTPRQPIIDLDSLPFIDFSNKEMSYMSYIEELKDEQKAIPIEVTRGCHGKCNFCSTRLYWGSLIRRKSNGRIISEMHYFYNQTGISRFLLIGDNFERSRKELIGFCKAMSNEAPEFRWICNLKLDRLEPNDLELLWDGGCRGFFVGMESASQYSLNMMQKEVDLKKRIAIIEKAIEIGFNVDTSFIIGFPWEKEEDLDNTLYLHHMMLKMGAYRSIVNILCPLPGTYLTENYPISFDFPISNIAFDGIPLDEKTRRLIQNYPRMFTQFGRFDNPNLSSDLLLATSDTATQLNNLKKYLEDV